MDQASQKDMYRLNICDISILNKLIFVFKITAILVLNVSSL
jgi:hypothetical protein